MAPELIISVLYFSSCGTVVVGVVLGVVVVVVVFASLERSNRCLFYDASIFCWRRLFVLSGYLTHSFPNIFCLATHAHYVRSLHF